MPTTPGNRGSGPVEPGPQEDAIRQLLEAAAARPDQLPGLSPFFTARVKAAARARAARRPIQLVAAVAWHALPALVALVAALAVWAGLEIGRDADAQEDVAMVVFENRAVGPDAPLTTLLLSSGPETPPKGGAR